jgi:regulator of replication initiation timing
MVVKKPALKKKRKVRKGITTKKQTKKGKGGNVSQVVNVYVNKANRRRATAPKQFTPAIQPQMYNAGQDNMILGLKQQNKTLMDILDKQRKTDTTPNSDITSLDDLIRVKKLDTPARTDIPERDENADYGGVASINPKYDRSDSTTTPTTKSKPNMSLSLPTTNRQNISDMLSSIAEGMDEIPQGNEIKNRIIAIGDQVRPLPQDLTGVRTRVAEINELDEMKKLELEYDGLVKQLQEQRRYDNTIRMANYTNRLPNKVSTLKKKIADMRNTLTRSIDKMGDQAL